MAGCLGAVLALAFGLLLGGANAGEETMAMRGVARSGRAEVAMPRIAPGADRPSAGTDTAKPSPKRRGASGGEYIGWKNTCLRAPLMVAGSAFDCAPSGGYGAARPYVRLLDEKTGFWECLFRELTPG